MAGKGRVYSNVLISITHLKEILNTDSGDLNDPVVQRERKRVRMKLAAISELFESREEHKKRSLIGNKQAWIQEWRQKCRLKR